MSKKSTTDMMVWRYHALVGWLVAGRRSHIWIFRLVP